jgi:hypothetical protein
MRCLYSGKYFVSGKKNPVWSNWRPLLDGMFQENIDNADDEDVILEVCENKKTVKILRCTAGNRDVGKAHFFYVASTKIPN